MARKVLVPVLPSERFYDAVVAAADLIRQEGGGLIVFLFTQTRRPVEDSDDDASDRADLLETEEDLDGGASVGELERWRGPLLKEVGVNCRVWVFPKMGHAIPSGQPLGEVGVLRLSLRISHKLLNGGQPLLQQLNLAAELRLRQACRRAGQVAGEDLNGGGQRRSKGDARQPKQLG